MRMSVAVATVAVLTGVVPVASAAPGAGATCQFARTNAHQVLSHGRVGVMTAGPYYVPGAARVILTCVVQRNSTDPSAPDAVSVSNSTVGPVGVLFDEDVRYVSGPGDTAYVCTEVSWVSAASGSAWLGCHVIPLG